MGKPDCPDTSSQLWFTLLWGSWWKGLGLGCSAWVAFRSGEFTGLVLCALLNRKNKIKQPPTKTKQKNNPFLLYLKRGEGLATDYRAKRDFLHILSVGLGWHSLSLLHCCNGPFCLLFEKQQGVSFPWLCEQLDLFQYLQEITKHFNFKKARRASSLGAMPQVGQKSLTQVRTRDSSASLRGVNQALKCAQVASDMLKAQAQLLKVFFLQRYLVSEIAL